MTDLRSSAAKREDKRQREALALFFKHSSRLQLPGSCHCVLNAIFNETLLKQCKDTTPLSKKELSKHTKLPTPTQDRAIARLKSEGWIETKRIANGGTIFTVTLPKKGPLYDVAGPKTKVVSRPKSKLRILPKPQK